MRRPLAAFALLGLLYGCGGGSYLPYVSNSLSSVQIHNLVAGAAARYDVPEGLVTAMVMAESAGDPNAVSSAGAQGLMQLMPATSASCGIADPFDPDENVDCGARYLRGLLQRYKNDVALAVAAYNAGPGAVDRYRGIPPFGETQAYVARVLADYRNY